MVSAYKFLLYPNSNIFDKIKIKDEIIDNTHHFIAILFFTIIKFYNLSFKDNENNCDILLEIITGRVVRKNLYLVIYNSITYWMQNEIEILEEKMAEEENVDFDNSRFLVGVSDIFSFNKSLRRE